jgi:activator of HSP90 ATPase
MSEKSTEFSLSHIFPVKAETIYNAWLDGEKHAAMTGGSAECKPEENTSFSTWDGYISGKNLKLIPNQKIIQSWRTTEFSPDDADSLVEIDLQTLTQGCRFTIKHSKIPGGQPDYEQGWIEYYITPMSEYFK